MRELEHSFSTVSANVNSRPTLSVFFLLRFTLFTEGRMERTHNKLCVALINTCHLTRMIATRERDRKEAGTKQRLRQGFFYRGKDPRMMTNGGHTIAHNQDTTHPEIFAHIQGYVLLIQNVRQNTMAEEKTAFRVENEKSVCTSVRYDRLHIRTPSIPLADSGFVFPHF